MNNICRKVTAKAKSFNVILSSLPMYFLEWILLPQKILLYQKLQLSIWNFLAIPPPNLYDILQKPKTINHDSLWEKTNILDSSTLLSWNFPLRDNNAEENRSNMYCRNTYTRFQPKIPTKPITYIWNIKKYTSFLHLHGA